MEISTHFQRLRLARWMIAALGVVACWPDVAAAYTPLSAAREERKIKVNSATVTLAADRPDSTLMKIADDLAIVMSDPDNLRLVPIAGDGALGNVRDLVFLRNVDMALTDVATMEHLRKQAAEEGLDINNEVAYIAPLFSDKIQILARRNIKTLQQLAGRRVNIGLSGSGTAVHAQTILKAFNINAKVSRDAQPDAVEMLIRGEIDAIICFCLGSPGLYQRVMFNYDLHLLPIPWSNRLPPQYMPAKLTQEDYPAFIPRNKTVDTIAVSLILVTYNWRKSDPRYERVASFVKRFFDRLPRLKEAPRHHAWKTVSASALVPGWKQFEAANEWMVASKDTVNHKNLQLVFEEYLDQWTSENKKVSPQQIKLFEEFLNWQEARR